MDESVQSNLDKYEIEINAGDVDLYHGTVQPLGSTIETFRLGRAEPMPKSAAARYNAPGEEVDALTKIDAVWMATDADGAQQYTTPRWGRDMAEGEQGQLYEVIASSARTAYVPYTDEESIEAALAADPQVIILEDRGEALVLDPSIIQVKTVTDNEGEDIAVVSPAVIQPTPGIAVVQSRESATTDPTDLPDFTQVTPGQIVTRPELFQPKEANTQNIKPRDVSSGLSEEMTFSIRQKSIDPAMPKNETSTRRRKTRGAKQSEDMGKAENATVRIISKSET